MEGFVANTDFDWFTYLRNQPDLDEVNFWQPSGARGFHAVAPGAPFFFKLKSPHKAIGGFGYFARSSSCPIGSLGTPSAGQMAHRTYRPCESAFANTADDLAASLETDFTSVVS